MEEAEVLCPFCGEYFTAVLDCSEDYQVYIEDCYVCCKPIEFHVRSHVGELQSVETRRGEGR